MFCISLSFSLNVFPFHAKFRLMMGEFPWKVSPLAIYNFRVHSPSRLSHTQKKTVIISTVTGNDAPFPYELHAERNEQELALDNSTDGRNSTVFFHNLSGSIS